MILGMWSARKLRRSFPSADEFQAALADALPEEGSVLLRTVAWTTAGAGALALGLYVGRELRQRYQFHRRTPYDFYAHSGDRLPDVEFGVGI